MLTTSNKPPSWAVHRDWHSRCRGIPAASLPVPARGSAPAGGWQTHSPTPIKKHQNPLCLTWEASAPGASSQGGGTAAFPAATGLRSTVLTLLAVKSMKERRCKCSTRTYFPSYSQHTFFWVVGFLQHIISEDAGPSREFYSLTAIPVAEDARKGLAATFHPRSKNEETSAGVWSCLFYNNFAGSEATCELPEEEQKPIHLQRMEVWYWPTAMRAQTPVTPASSQ